MFPVSTLNLELHVVASSCLSQQIFNFALNELASMKQLNNSLQLPKPTADTSKIQNKLTIVCSSNKKKKKMQFKTILFIT